MNSRSGFTLVELLVVMAIMAVLVGIAVAGLGFAMRQSRNTSRLSALSNLDRALQAYYSDHPAYPVDSELENDLSNLVDSEEFLLPYLEGSWKVAPQTEVYYKSTDGLLYTVCVSQENSGGEVAYICTGSAIGTDGYPEKEIEPVEGGDDGCTDCEGVCGLWDGTDTFVQCDLN